MNTKNSANKGGRPRKEDPIKEIFRTVRFSPTEDELLAKKIAEFGGTRSDFIRKAALGATVKSVPSPEVMQLLQEYRMNLRNIGMALKAIALRANAEEDKFGYQDLQEAQQVCRDFSQTVKRIQKEIM